MIFFIIKICHSLTPYALRPLYIGILSSSNSLYLQGKRSLRKSLLTEGLGRHFMILPTGVGKSLRPGGERASDQSKKGIPTRVGTTSRHTRKLLVT